jgi:hypothetical protein
MPARVASCGGGGHHASSRLRRFTPRSTKKATTARIGNMNSDTRRRAGCCRQHADLEGVGREDMRQVARAAIGQHADDVVVREGHDQAEQHVMEMMLRIIGSVT